MYCWKYRSFWIDSTKRTSDNFNCSIFNHYYHDLVNTLMKFKILEENTHSFHKNLRQSYGKFDSFAWFYWFFQFLSPYPCRCCRTANVHINNPVRIHFNNGGSRFPPRVAFSMFFIKQNKNQRNKKRIPDSDIFHVVRHCDKESVFGIILVIQTEWVLLIYPYLVQMRENADQNNAE